jgi:hypothetical protein
MIVVKKKCKIGEAGDIIASPTPYERKFAKSNPTVCRFIEKPKPVYKPKSKPKSVPKSTDNTKKEGK